MVDGYISIERVNMPLDKPTVNIRRLDTPSSLENLSQEVISIGDLHGNPMKLIHILARYGILEINDEDFQDLWEAYDAMDVKIDSPEAADCVAAQINFFCTIVRCLDVNKPGLLILIGDELADRGHNDFLMLYILFILHREKVPYWIQLSNHGLQALGYFENNPLDRYAKVGQEASLDALDRLRAYSPKLYDNLMKNYVEDVYRKHIALIGYQIQDDGKLGIYTHAPINYFMLKNLATEFGVGFNAKNLIQTIDAINAKASEAICAGSFVAQYIRKSNYEQSALYALIWNRKKLEPHEASLFSFAFVFNVHGHVGPNFHASPKHINLDNDLGKPYEESLNSKGEVVKISADDEGESLVFRNRLMPSDYQNQYYQAATRHMYAQEEPAMAAAAVQHVSVHVATPTNANAFFEKKRPMPEEMGQDPSPEPKAPRTKSDNP